MVEVAPNQAKQIMTAAAQIEAVGVKKGIEQRQQKVKEVRQKLNSHSPKFISLGHR